MNILLKIRIVALKKFFIGILSIFMVSSILLSCTNTEIEDEITQEQIDEFAVDPTEIRRPGGGG